MRCLRWVGSTGAICSLTVRTHSLSARVVLRELAKNNHLFRCLVRADVVLLMAMTPMLADLVGGRGHLLHNYGVRPGIRVVAFCNTSSTKCAGVLGKAAGSAN